MRIRHAAAALACGALVLLPGCGSSGSKGKIPRDQANRMNRAIAAADNYSSSGSCGRAHTKVRDARYVLSQVPTSVDKSVRQGIADGLARLDSLITSECARPTKTQTTTQSQTTTTPSTTTPTTTTPSTTTPTTTTPSTTTPTTTTPSTTTPTTPTTTTGNGGTPPAGGQGNG